MDESWRDRFSEYATGAAFHITLSKPQYQTLHRLALMEKAYADAKATTKHQRLTVWAAYPGPTHHQTMIALERKGMLSHDGDGYHVTDAGFKTLELVYIVFPEERDKTIPCIRTIGKVSAE